MGLRILLFDNKFAHLQVSLLHSNTEFLMLNQYVELQAKVFFYCSDASLLSLASPQVEHSMTTGRAAHSVDIRCEHAILAGLTYWRVIVDDHFYLHTSNNRFKTKYLFQQTE